MLDLTTKVNIGAYIRKIKCPRHFLVKPGKNPFLMERIPSLKNIKESDAKRLKLNLWRPKKDKNGQKIYDRNNYYQPEVSAAEVRVRVYDKTSPICMQCKRCVTA